MTYHLSIGHWMGFHLFVILTAAMIFPFNCPVPEATLYFHNWTWVEQLEIPFLHLLPALVTYFSSFTRPAISRRVLWFGSSPALCVSVRHLQTILTILTAIIKIIYIFLFLVVGQHRPVSAQRKVLTQPRIRRSSLLHNLLAPQQVLCTPMPPHRNNFSLVTF